DVGAVGRLAAGESPGSSCRRRLCPCAQGLSDIHSPGAATIVLVQDNLSTHKPASPYEAFPAPEARRLAERFGWHYTPKHGSWLDMAESEHGVLSAQCLDRRIPDKQTLTTEVAAWEQHRNTHHAKADWQFTTADARIRLKRLSVRMTQATSASCAERCYRLLLASDGRYSRVMSELPGLAKWRTSALRRFRKAQLALGVERVSCRYFGARYEVS